MKYDNIFPTGILVHDVPVWVAKQVEKLVEERVDKLQRPDDNEETDFTSIHNHFRLPVFKK